MFSAGAVEAKEELPSAAHLAYLPGLDGLRAWAVIAVMLYHAGFNVAGGYLGVESFFVLSGFLITALLLAEWRRDGRIDIGRFWLRRARRLLPALFAMLAGTCLIAAVLLPDELRSFGGDALAALLYVMNWKLVLGQQSYFDAFDRPPLLQHLWSLAVEEQFYVIWPLVFAFGMRLLRGRGFFWAVVAGAVASAWLMFALYDPGSDPSRIYYGTDTRAAGLLIGAALALVWTPERRRQLSPRLGPAFDLAGAGALAGLLAAYLWLSEQHPLLYHGGFQLVALATSVVVVATTFPGARLLPALLEIKPLRWIGVRSYSLYLWHWPIFLVLRPGADLPLQGWALELTRFGLACVAAALSYRFIEQPIRARGFIGAWQALRAAAPAAWGIPQRRTLVAAVSGLLVVIVGAAAIALRPTNAAPQQALVATSAPRAEQARPTLAPTAQLGEAETPVPLAAVPPNETDNVRVARELPHAASPTPQATVPATPTPPTEPPLAPALTAELQHLLDETVADGFVPGAVLSVSLPGYAPWTGASGLADRGQSQAMEPNSTVRIASVSKMFTAVVVLQLVEEGVIELDAPIGTWLPDIVPNADVITIRNLLQHTSGLYDYLEDRNFVAQTQREPERTWQPQELVTYATRFPSREIGRWDYSSTNYVILGMLVEQVTQQSLAQQMRQRIFEPLGMRQTSFLPQEPVQGTLAHGYTRGTDITGASMSFAFATGNIATTAEELQRFGRALFEGELLQAETRDLMLQFVSGRGQYDMPALEYGLGVMRNRLAIGKGHAADAGVVLGHIGGYGGFRAAMWYVPASGAVITISLNQAQVDPNNLAADVLNELLQGEQ